VCTSQHAPVCIAVKREPQCGSALLNLCGDPLRVECSASIVDVATVWRYVQQRKAIPGSRTESSEQFWCYGSSGTVGAIGNERQTIQLETGDRFDEELNVVLGKGCIIFNAREF
jgi:hypothetical protein